MTDTAELVQVYPPVPKAQKQPQKTRRIGGSDVAKLLGTSKYGNAMDVYMRIVEGIDDEWSPMMERGAAVEPQLRAFAQNFLGIELDHPESDYHEHPTYEFARAQIDDLARIQGLPVCVDYKSVNRFAKGWGAPNTDQVPESYRAQFAWEMLCADRPLTIVVAGFGEDVPPPGIFNLSHVVPYQVEREPLFESYCIQVVRKFWLEHVVPMRPPAVKAIGKKAVKK